MNRKSQALHQSNSKRVMNLLQRRMSQLQPVQVKLNQSQRQKLQFLNNQQHQQLHHQRHQHHHNHQRSQQLQVVLKQQAKI